jgi:hypothetical protein
MVLAFPLAANLDTGNINLVLALMLWAAQFVGPRLGGLLWALAAWMKWVPALYWLLLAPRARLWGLGWLAVSIGLSLVTLPLTIIQLQTLFGFGARPVRLDFLVFLWAAVPWLYRRPEPFAWLRPATWRAFARSAWDGSRATAGRWRRDPEQTAGALRRGVDRRVREFLGLRA